MLSLPFLMMPIVILLSRMKLITAKTPAVRIRHLLRLRCIEVMNKIMLCAYTKRSVIFKT